MKTIFAKMGILMTLIFSFLFSSFGGNFVYASSSVNQETIYNKVALTEVVYANNAITVKLKEKRNVVAFTYEYAYINADGVKVSELATAKDIGTTNNVSYTFLNTTGEDLVGIKVWKVQFKETDTYFPDWMSEGSNSWSAEGTTGIDGAIRLKLLQVTKNQLKYDITNECKEFDKAWDVVWNDDICEGALTLYFSFDNEEQNIIIDSIYELKATATYYDLVTTYKWALPSKIDSVEKTNQKNVELHLKSENKASFTTIEGIVVENMPIIGESKNPDYDWYAIFETAEGIQLGLEVEREGFLGARRVDIEHKLDEVAIFWIKYIYDGEFYESEVLDFGTGIHVYTVVEDENWFDKLIDAIDWLIANWWKVLIGIVVAIILVWGLIKFGIKAIIVGIGYILKYLFIAIWFILKWTIFLPITLIVRHVKKKEDDDLW